MTEQTISPFYLNFGLVLASLFLFGIIYAYAVRRLSNSGVQGQTAWMVVVGVVVTVLAGSIVIGTQSAINLLICFAASGIPMIVEYVARVHGEQSRDQQSAEKVAKDLLK